MIHLVFYDLETTGTNINRDAVVQLGALQCIYDEDTGKLSPATVLINTMCNPGAPIPEEATEVHGITDADVAWAPPDKQALYQFSLLLRRMSVNNPVVLVGHNIERFDTPMIMQRWPTGMFNVNYSSIDTYTIALREWPAMPHKLEELYDWYAQGTPVKAHDAAADCYMVHSFLDKYLKESGKTLEQLVDWLDEAVILETYPFGKHKGLPVKDVPHNYLKWCAANFTEVHKDVELTICDALGIENFCEADANASVKK
jgi:DNA polymerase-3 subunit epsilon